MKKIYAVVAFESGEIPEPVSYCETRELAVYACEKLNKDLSHYSPIVYTPLTYTLCQNKFDLEKEWDKLK